MTSAPEDSPASFVLYASRLCPYAQRVRIALRELKADFEEVEIDLETPRPDWYLKINPNGLVPALKISGTKFGFKDTIVVESDIIVRLLADLYPGKFLPSSLEGPYTRTQANQFIYSFDSGLSALLYRIAKQESDKDRAESVEKALDLIVNDLEKQLIKVGTEPFFGGHPTLGLVELFFGPALIRIWSERHFGRLLPQSFYSTVAEKAPVFNNWADRVVAHEVVRETFPRDEAFKLFYKRYDVRYKE